MSRTPGVKETHDVPTHRDRSCNPSHQASSSVSPLNPPKDDPQQGQPSLGLRRGIYAGFRPPRPYTPESDKATDDNPLNSITCGVPCLPNSQRLHENSISAPKRVKQDPLVACGPSAGAHKGTACESTGLLDFQPSIFDSLENMDSQGPLSTSSDPSSLTLEMIPKNTQQQQEQRKRPSSPRKEVGVYSARISGLRGSSVVRQPEPHVSGSRTHSSSGLKKLQIHPAVKRPVHTLLNYKMYHSMKAFTPFKSPSPADAEEHIPHRPGASAATNSSPLLRKELVTLASEAARQIATNPYLFARHWHSNAYGISPRSFRPLGTIPSSTTATTTAQQVLESAWGQGSVGQSQSVEIAESFLRNRCNEEQWRAVCAPPQGVSVVIAGPGSGKTRCIVHRIAYLLHVKCIPPRHILAVTFTNRAAREMSSRLESLNAEMTQLLAPSRGKPWRCPWVRTFHGFCRVLVSSHSELLFPPHVLAPAAEGRPSQPVLTFKRVLAPWEASIRSSSESSLAVNLSQGSLDLLPNGELDSSKSDYEPDQGDILALIGLLHHSEIDHEDLSQRFYIHQQEEFKLGGQHIKDALVQISILDEREQEKIISECLKVIQQESQVSPPLFSPLVRIPKNYPHVTQEYMPVTPASLMPMNRGSTEWSLMIDGCILLLRGLALLADLTQSNDSMEAFRVYGVARPADEFLQSKWGLPRANSWLRQQLMNRISSSNREEFACLSYLTAICPLASIATLCDLLITRRIDTPPPPPPSNGMRRSSAYKNLYTPEVLMHARKIVQGQLEMEHGSANDSSLEVTTNNPFESILNRDSQVDGQASKRGVTVKELADVEFKAKVRWMALAGSSMNRALMQRPMIDPAFIFGPIAVSRQDHPSKSSHSSSANQLGNFVWNLQWSLEKSESLSWLPKIEMIRLTSCTPPKMASNYKATIDTAKSHAVGALDLLTVVLLVIRIVAHEVSLTNRRMTMAPSHPNSSSESIVSIPLQPMDVQDFLGNSDDHWDEEVSESNDQPWLRSIIKRALDSTLQCAEHQWTSLVYGLLGRDKSLEPTPALAIPLEQWSTLRRLMEMKTEGIRSIFRNCKQNLYYLLLTAIVYQRYEQQLSKIYALDFSDLLLKGLHLSAGYLPAKLWLRHRFRHLLVDEVQDSSTLQYILIKAILPPCQLRSTQDTCNPAVGSSVSTTSSPLPTSVHSDSPALLMDWDDSVWKEIESDLHMSSALEPVNSQQRRKERLGSSECSLFVVGDPNQSIYLWRYADPSSMESIFYEYDGAREYALRQNYRSTSRIVAFANQLIDIPSVSQLISSTGKKTKLSNALGWTLAPPGHKPWIIECLAPEQEAIVAWLLVKHLTTVGELRWRPKRSLRNQSSSLSQVEEIQEQEMEPYYHVYKQHDIAILYRSVATGRLLQKVFAELSKPDRDLNSLWGLENASKFNPAPDRTLTSSTRPYLQLAATPRIDPSGLEQLANDIADHVQAATPYETPRLGQIAEVAGFQRRHEMKTQRNVQTIQRAIDLDVPMPLKLNTLGAHDSFDSSEIVGKYLSLIQSYQQNAASEMPATPQNAEVKRFLSLIQRFEPHLFSILSRAPSSTALSNASLLNPDWSMNYIVVGGRRSAAAVETRVLLSYLSLACGGNDLHAVAYAINVPNRGLGPSSVERIVTFLSESPLFTSGTARTTLNMPYIERLLWSLDQVYPDLHTLVVRRKYLKAFKSYWAEHTQAHQQEPLSTNHRDGNSIMAGLAESARSHSVSGDASERTMTDIEATAVEDSLHTGIVSAKEVQNRLSSAIHSKTTARVSTTKANVAKSDIMSSTKHPNKLKQPSGLKKSFTAPGDQASIKLWFTSEAQAPGTPTTDPRSSEEAASGSLGHADTRIEHINSAGTAVSDCDRANGDVPTSETATDSDLELGQSDVESRPIGVHFIPTASHPLAGSRVQYQTSLLAPELLASRRSTSPPPHQLPQAKVTKPRPVPEENKSTWMKLGVTLTSNAPANQDPARGKSDSRSQASMRKTKGTANLPSSDSSIMDESLFESWLDKLIPFICRNQTQKRSHLQKLEGLGFPRLAGAKWDALLQFTLTILRIRRFLFGTLASEGGAIYDPLLNEIDELVADGSLGQILHSASLASTFATDNVDQASEHADGRQRILFSIPPSVRALELRFMPERRCPAGSGLAEKVRADVNHIRSQEGPSGEREMLCRLGATPVWDTAVMQELEDSDDGGPITAGPLQLDKPSGAGLPLSRFFGWYPYLDSPVVSSPGGGINVLPASVVSDYVIELTRYRQYLTADAEATAERRQKKRKKKGLANSGDGGEAAEDDNEEANENGDEEMGEQAGDQHDEELAGDEMSPLEGLEQFRAHAAYHDQFYATKLLAEGYMETYSVPQLLRRCDPLSTSSLKLDEEGKIGTIADALRALCELKVDQQFFGVLGCGEGAIGTKLAEAYRERLAAIVPALGPLKGIDTVSIESVHCTHSSAKTMDVQDLSRGFFEEWLRQSSVTIALLRRQSQFKWGLPGFEDASDDICKNPTTPNGLFVKLASLTLSHTVTCSLLGGFSASRELYSYLATLRPLTDPALTDVDAHLDRNSNLTLDPADQPILERASAVLSFVEEARLDNTLTGNIESPAASNASSPIPNEQIALMELDPDEENESTEATPRHPTGDSRVTISTIHGAKGLEWPVVIVVGADDGRIPRGDVAQLADSTCPPDNPTSFVQEFLKNKGNDAQQDSTSSQASSFGAALESDLDTYSQAAIQKSARPTRNVPLCFDQLDEERRLLYVASTRAQRRLFVTFSLTREKTLPLDCSAVTRALPDRRAAQAEVELEDAIARLEDERERSCDGRMGASGEAHGGGIESEKLVAPVQSSNHLVPIRSLSNLNDSQQLHLAEAYLERRKQFVKNQNAPQVLSQPKLGSIALTPYLSEYGPRMSRFLYFVTRRNLFQLSPPSDASLSVNDLDEDDVFVTSFAMPLLYFSRAHAHLTVDRFQGNRPRHSGADEIRSHKGTTTY